MKDKIKWAADACPLADAHRLVSWSRGDNRRLEAAIRWIAEGRHRETIGAAIYAAHHFGVRHADVPDPSTSYRAWYAASRWSGSGLAPEDVRDLILEETSGDLPQ